MKLICIMCRKRLVHQLVCDESDCMFTLAYARQFVIDNLECIWKICRGEIVTPFWKSFSEFTGIPLGAVAVADCDYFI